MTEETAVRIAETLESVKDAIATIEAWVIVFSIVFGIAFLVLYIITKD